jgi:hypothetical protein
MTEEEAQKLRETISRRFPHETLDLMQLGGNQYAVRFVGGANHSRIVWDTNDWHEYVGIKPPVAREEEEEEVL